MHTEKKKTVLGTWCLSLAAVLSLIFSVHAPAAGTYDLQWRYANGTTTDRTGTVSVGGSAQATNISFAGTGAWATWALSPVVSVDLEAGNNSIQLIAETSGGLANIDWMEVTGQSPSPGE